MPNLTPGTYMHVLNSHGDRSILRPEIPNPMSPTGSGGHAAWRDRRVPSGPMDTTCELVEAAESHTHVRLCGPLDIAGTGKVSLRFTAATAGRKRHVVVDMSAVTFVSSIGLGMLVQAARALTPERKRIVLATPAPAVAAVIRSSKLDNLMPIADSVEAAKALLA